MSKKVNKISINKLESTMTNNVISFPMNGYPDIEVTVRRVLPLHDVMQFVADVVSTCVDMETGEYVPEVQAFAVRSSVLTMYANFTLPKDPQKQYDLIYNTTAFQQVLDVIDRVQYDEILYSINERIKHEVAMMESTMARQVAELTDNMTRFIKNSEEVFGSVHGDDMGVLIKELSKMGKVDEEKLVNAVINSGHKPEPSEPDKASDISTDGKVITLHKSKE